MAFASIHVPNFMVQAVVRAEVELRDRAVALVDGSAPLVSVVAANEAAWRAGIQWGMAQAQAQLCGVEIRRRSRAREKAAHGALLDLGWSLSPRVEDHAPDTILADLAGLNSLSGPDENIAREFMRRAEELRLRVQVAVSANLEVAVHAARGFAGITLIAEGEEAKHLSSLPVHTLGPSAEALETLERWGIRTCAALGALPALELSERLGQEGVRLQELARGAHRRSLVLAEPAERLEEEMELDDAVEDLEPLAFVLGRLLDQLCARLAARALSAAAIRVRFELGDAFERDFQVLNENVSTKRFAEQREILAAGVKTPDGNCQRGTSAAKAELHMQANVVAKATTHKDSRATTQAPKLGPPKEADFSVSANCKDVPNNYEKVLNLPAPMRDSKMLLKLLRLQLQADPPAGAIVKIMLAADPARPRTTQHGLFVPNSPDPEKLELTVARLAKLVGNTNIGSPELVDTHRPGEFRMNRFFPQGNETRARGRAGSAGKKAVAGGEPAARRPATGCRIFRPSLPARVELREERPAKIFFRGWYGRVVTASGPWRTSGDWWREDSWQQEEWDLEIRFEGGNAGASLAANVPAIVPVQDAKAREGLYCVYYDMACRGWFVRGMYD
ncbi:MAG: DNA polymerase Y family protein [Candidatus Acidiferrales bacterium]